MLFEGWKPETASLMVMFVMFWYYRVVAKTRSAAAIPAWVKRTPTAKVRVQPTFSRPDLIPESRVA